MDGVYKPVTLVLLTLPAILLSRSPSSSSSHLACLSERLLLPAPRAKSSRKAAQEREQESRERATKEKGEPEEPGQACPLACHACCLSLTDWAFSLDGSNDTSTKESESESEGEPLPSWTPSLLNTTPLKLILTIKASTRPL